MDAQYKPGEQLAGTVYRVVRHLATGGMGSVYDVEDITVGKRYVLKTLHPQLVSRQDLAKRMQAEARTLAQLQHPNIVDVVTAGITTDAQKMPFYVMERLNGQNLRVVLEKKGSLELAHCCRVAIDVADALEHAHENAVIHRDVKPENIFLHRNPNGTTTTKLLDFGIMRLLDRKASHTQGKFIGTLRYASPEQIMGGDLGPATDIYSLGIVLYEMLCGRGPFDEIGDAYAIGAAHAQMPPPPVSAFATVPPALERLVMQTIAKSPHERPRDCFSFAGELRKLLREEEHAPRSATAVNVLSSIPATRSADAFKKTEPSEPSGAPVPSTEKEGPTQRDPALAGSQTLLEAGADPATAPTVASDPGTPARMPSGAPPPHVVVHEQARAASARPPSGVNRDAPTRASAPIGNTRRLAQHGTQMEELVAPDDAVRAALAEPAPLVVPPQHGAGGPPSGELVFPRSAYTTNGSVGTGPMAAEAQTRPPDRGMMLPIVAAVVVAAVLIGGALVIVKRPWASANAPPPPVVETSPPTPTVTAPPRSASIEPVSASVTAPPSSATAPLATATGAGGHSHRGPRGARPTETAATTSTGAPAPPPTTPPSPATTPKKPSSGPLKPEEVPF